MDTICAQSQRYICPVVDHQSRTALANRFEQRAAQLVQIAGG